MDVCPDCTQPVTPMITTTGRRVDLEPDVHPDGIWITVVMSDGAVRARAVVTSERPIDNGRRHHRCPPTPEPGPNCYHCGNPMPRQIATELDWTTHPACDPEYLDQIAAEYQIARARQFRQGKKGRRR